MNEKKIRLKKMSEEEETVQRALGTLPKFEVAVQREITRKTFARVLVSAPTKAAAKERAIKIVSSGKTDDTEQPVSWADNEEGTSDSPTIDKVTELGEDHYLIHRFTKKRTKEEGDDDEDEGKIDINSLGITV